MKIHDLVSLIQTVLNKSVYVTEAEDGEILICTRHQLVGDDEELIALDAEEVTQ